MARARGKWQCIAVLTTVVCLGSTAAAYSQFTSFNDRSRALLQGHWQSCREDDGQYAERIYDGRLAGLGPFELHMGPYHEFALFRGVQDVHRRHDSAENLLHPYNVEVSRAFGNHKWDVAGLQLEVVLAGGSREDCESWVISLTRSPSSSSH
jgi:hypothetical protein